MAGALKQKRKFMTLSGVFKRQTAFGTPLADVDLDTRHNADITIEEIVDVENVFDCDGDDLVSETLNSRLKRFRISYSSVTPQIIAGWLAMALGTSGAPTGTPANEVQTLTGDATGGTFTLSFSFEGKSGTTGAIAYNADAPTVQAALQTIPFLTGIVACAGTISGGMTITFLGDLQKGNLPLVVADPTNLTGGTAVVTSATDGTNKIHQITRSTSDDLPKTSIGIGFKDDSTDPVKQADITVEEITITLAKRRSVTMEVVAVGTFSASEMASYTLPDCSNIVGLKSSDCRVAVDDTFYNEDLWNATIRIVNNVPTGDDAFPFDSIDASVLQRGDNPTYPVSLQILGSRGDDIHELAKDRALAPVDFHLGKVGNRVSIGFPNSRIAFASTPETFVGELNRSAVALEITPFKDSILGTPVEVWANLDQTAQFLAT